MNDQTLERLLIDRSLGALSPDVDELLAAYLATRPDVKDDFPRVVSAARDAMKQQATAIEPPAVESFRIELFEDRRPRWRGEVMRLAASVLIACGVTAWFVKSNASPTSLQPIQVVQQTAPSTPTSAVA